MIIFTENPVVIASSMTAMPICTGATYSSSGANAAAEPIRVASSPCYSSADVNAMSVLKDSHILQSSRAAE